MGNYFTPTIGARETLSVTGTSSSVTIAAGEGDTLVLCNTGANTAYIRWGAGSQTAVTTDFPLLAGATIAVGAASSVSATVVAAITASSTTTVEVNPGRGQFVGFSTAGSASISVSGAVTAVGTVAEDSSVSSVAPLIVGGIARTSDVTAVTAADGVRFPTDTIGRQIILPYALPGNTWTSVSSADITDTSTNVIKAAVASTRHYISAITISNTDATVNTRVDIFTAGTLLWTGPAAANCGGYSVSFPVPLRGGVNESLAAQCGTTSAEVRFAVVGFSAAV